jgi:hypothetical protein
MSRSGSSKVTKPRLELKRVMSDEELARKPSEYERRGARSARSTRDNSDSHRAVSSRDRPRDRESDRSRAEGRDRDRDRKHRSGKEREKDRHERSTGRHHRDHSSREGDRVRERNYHESGSQSHRDHHRVEDYGEDRKALSRSSHELTVAKSGRDNGDRLARLNRTTSDLQLDKSVSKRVAEEDELTDDNDFSSEEEVEEEGQKVTRMRRSQSINREALLEPKLLEGWLGWLSEGMFFNRWKRGYFQLEYPFLNLYTETPPSSIRDRVNYKPKGKMSMRGGCLVDAKMVGDPRNAGHVSKRFRIRSGQKEWVLEAESPAQKAAWVSALRTHIEYANPAKRANGVGYDCKVRSRLAVSLCHHLLVCDQ